MADQAVTNDKFIYTGGRAPQHTINACISKSIREIPDYAFNQCTRLMHVQFHNDVNTVGKWAFPGCCSLQSIQLLGVEILRSNAFYNCTGLTDVEFGDKLKTIGLGAFYKCTSIKKLDIKRVKSIESGAFNGCEQLVDVSLPEEVERLEQYAFANCRSMRRIAMPLKSGLVANNVFNYCENLERIDLVGDVHRMISYFNLESWKDEMNDEINRINQILPHTPATGTIVGGKNEAIKRWLECTYRKMQHYTAEHNRFLQETGILLTLALWKAKIGEYHKEDAADRKEDALHHAFATKVEISQCNSKRSEHRVTSGADIVIKNVLPFLTLK